MSRPRVPVAGAAAVGSAPPPGPRPRRRPARYRHPVLLLGVLVALLPALAGCGRDGGELPTGVIDLSADEGGEVSPSGRVLLGGFTEVRVIVTAADGTTREFCLLLADDPDEWARGLMQVVDLGGYEGMLFAFPEDRTGSFFMRNTPTPLSIAFLDEAGAVVSSTDMQPCADRDGCPTYAADGPYRTAVEVPQGALSTLGLDDPGATLATAGSCAPVST